MSTKKSLVVVANRLPVHRVSSRGQRARWETSPGGLVAALTPILKGRSGSWVGWAGTAGGAPRRFTHQGIALHPIGLSRQLVEGFYERFSNRTLWPLYHDVVRRPEFHRGWWKDYREANTRFAEMTAKVAPRRATVWVHDYQLQLVPQLLRTLRPDLRIGYFLHIPFPPLELLAQLPWRRELMEGLLGADLIGLQTKDDARNMRRAAVRLGGAHGRGEDLAVGERRVRVAAYPISIDVASFETLADTPVVLAKSFAFRRRLGLDRQVILGIDRLDYTKGIDTRLRAYEELLASGRVDPARAVFVQVAVPSRERVEEYAEIREEVEGWVGRINGRFSTVGLTTVHYLRRSLNPEDLVALYRAADVMVVTPYRDGMNLVAKEYVASRTDNTGALVLSEFAGAARSLTAALQVNPHDIDGMEDTIHRAMHLTVEEQRQRMRSLRRVVRRHNVHDWANRFLGDLTG